MIEHWIEKFRIGENYSCYKCVMLRPSNIFRWHIVSGNLRL